MLRNAKKSMEGSEGGKTARSGGHIQPGGDRGSAQWRLGESRVYLRSGLLAALGRNRALAPRLRPRAFEARRRGERGRAPRERLRNGRGPGAAPSEGCCARATNRQNQG